MEDDRVAERAAIKAFLDASAALSEHLGVGQQPRPKDPEMATSLDLAWIVRADDLKARVDAAFVEWRIAAAARHGT